MNDNNRLTRPCWPDGARCVAAITVDFDGPSVEIGEGNVPLGIYSHGRYAAKCGVPRYLDLIERQGIPVTFFVPGYDAEQYPDSVRAIAASDCEVACHGYFHEGWDLGDHEHYWLRRTHDIITELTGRQPRGWRSPAGQKTVRTMRYLKKLGYVYDSSDKDHDLPYLACYDGNEHCDFLELPNNTASLDDFPFYNVSFTPPSEVLTHWIEEFEATYAEGGYFNLTIHPRTGYGSGSPARARVVESLIEHIRRHEDVKFVTLLELATWCLSRPGQWRKLPRSDTAEHLA